MQSHIRVRETGTVRWLLAAMVALMPIAPVFAQTLYLPLDNRRVRQLVDTVGMDRLLDQLPE
ncbi:MAG TPA: hypothetical protein VND80_07330 [Steroidobacteraceae bacterium]|nr:hypothetical protein [Steroidobacteraceae bacterium]